MEAFRGEVLALKTSIKMAIKIPGTILPGSEVNVTQWNVCVCTYCTYLRMVAKLVKVPLELQLCYVGLLEYIVCLISFILVKAFFLPFTGVPNFRTKMTNSLYAAHKVLGDCRVEKWRMHFQCSQD